MTRHRILIARLGIVLSPIAFLAVTFFAVQSASATETEFWQLYRAADQATYLLVACDDDGLPKGTASVTKVAQLGRVDFPEGRFGRGARFDGKSALRYTTGGVFSGGYVSIEAWIKLDRYPEKRSYIVCRPARVDGDAAFDPEADVTKGFGLFVDGGGALHLEITNCGYGATILTSSRPGVVPLGKWVHVAGISANFPIAHRRLFVDGHEVRAVPITWGKGLVVHGEEETQPGPIYLGNNASGDAGLAGVLDQVRIHRAIVKFWPHEDDSWTQANQPGRIPCSFPHFLPEHHPALYLPLDGDLHAQNQPIQGLEVRGGETFEPGVCGQALRGQLALTAPELIDLQEGTLEFWLRPGAVNSYTDRNYGFVRGPFIFYIYNSGGLANKPLTLYFRKADGDLQFVKAGDFETHPGKWYHFVITWRNDEVAVYADGKLGERSFGVPLAAGSDNRACGQLVLSAPHSLVDEVRLYPKALSPEEAANAYYRYVDRSKLTQAVRRAVRLRALYFPSQNRVLYRLSAETPRVERAKLTLSDRSGKTIVERTVAIVEDERTLDLPDLPNGRYVLSATALLEDGSQHPGEEFRFRRHHFAWEGNHPGLGSEVYSPFVPIRVAGGRVSVVEREYRLNGWGLLDGVVSAGRELLAGPISVCCETAGGESGWTSVEGTFTTVRPDLAVFEAEAISPALALTTRSAIEVDGCMRVEMALGPGKRPAQVERLWLEIPLRVAETPLMHVVTAGLRRNYSGEVPDGEGAVWDGSKAHRYQRWLNPFVPYIWLGSPLRGLAWFAENDRGWITQKTPEAAVQELIRQGDRLVLRVYLVNQPATITRRHDLVFGLQASPTKPMPRDWRSRVPYAPGGLAVVPWGGLQCASQAPLRDDWRIVDKICAVRRGNPFDDTWFQRYAEQHQPPPAHGHWPWLDQVRHFAGRARTVGPDKPLAVYQEEMRGCTARPEWAVFQDKWTTHPHRYQRTPLPDAVFEHGYQTLGDPESITFPRSYRDFGCWIADQWLRRGVSLYWDNTYPYASTNTRTTAAYRTADGRVQPCMIIWNQRAYAKRVWHLLQRWRRQRPEPLEFTLHMTNTQLLPVHTWGTVNLDHELDTELPFSPAWLQTETVGRQVGNLPLTLYNLTGQSQKALEGLSPQEKAFAEWGMRVVHEIGRGGSMEMEKALWDFGYATPAVVVHNYWADRPALRVQCDNVKWLLAADSAKRTCLIVFASWSQEPQRVEATVDPAILGFPADGLVTDLASQRPAGRIRGGQFSFELEHKYGVKVFRVESQMGRPASR